MRAVIQRVTRASVTVDNQSIAAIDGGLLVLLGIECGDDQGDVTYLANKTADLRIFEDSTGKMNLSILDCYGKILVVSQFTLLADCRKGRRPGFSAAAPPQQAEPLCHDFVEELRRRGIEVQTGKFRADMAVELVNDGPVTILLDSHKGF